MTETTDQTDPADLGYEEARDELVATVQRLEAGGVGLEESLALWERGEALATTCQRWLDGARERLERAGRQKADQNGDGDAEPDGGV